MTMVDEIKLRQFIGRTLGNLSGALSVPLAIVRWAAIVVLLAAAGQASTSRPLATSERLDTPPQRATALTDSTQTKPDVAANRNVEPWAPAGFGWG